MIGTNFKRQARASLQGRWGMTFGAQLLFCLPFLAFELILSWLNSNGPSPIPTKLTKIINTVFWLVLLGPCSLSLQSFYLRIIDNEKLTVDAIFDGFNQFGKALTTYLWMILKLLPWYLLSTLYNLVPDSPNVWISLIFSIPLAIAKIRYDFVFFILSDEPDITPKDALNKSEEMMRGHQVFYIFLMLSFIGWFILGFLSLVVGAFFVGSYYWCTIAHFYRERKARIEDSHSESDDLGSENASIDYVDDGRKDFTTQD